MLISQTVTALWHTLTKTCRHKLFDVHRPIHSDTQIKTILFDATAITTANNNNYNK